MQETVPEEISERTQPEAAPDLANDATTPPQPAGPEEDPNEVHIRIPATLVIALATLVLGIALGYFGRPIVTPDPLPVVQTVVVQVTAPPAALAAPAAAAAPPTSVPAANSSAATATVATARRAVIDKLIAQTRHFKGDPNAPVTILDFSDFQ
ncbi:MAG: hypothetical protein EXR62_17500 [Chloroflexi bacterium]|nr:hypothetical protein [Chloroflexota bacterium]